jgi:hypothetical protein
MNAKNTTPSQQRRYVMSATQSRFGAGALKSRSTRSGRRRAAKSGLVVRQGLPRRFAPQMPWTRINRSTRPRPTGSPARVSAFHIRRDP